VVFIYDTPAYIHDLRSGKGKFGIQEIFSGA